MSTPESNGRGPADVDEPDHPAETARVDDELFDDGDDEGVEDEASTGLEIAFTPRQILGGFALLAALILLLRRRRPR
jgi:MYXO-CTERM domain-containing protein